MDDRRGVITKDEAKLNVSFLQVQQQDNIVGCGLLLLLIVLNFVLWVEQVYLRQNSTR